jgi:hypothetical protein
MDSNSSVSSSFFNGLNSADHRPARLELARAWWREGEGTSKATVVEAVQEDSIPTTVFQQAELLLFLEATYQFLKKHLRESIRR